MAEVVGLDGKRVEGVENLDVTCAYAAVQLRQLVEQLERGELKVESWIFLCEKISDTHPGEINPRTLDSGISAQCAICMLEAEKLRIMTRLGVIQPKFY